MWPPCGSPQLALQEVGRAVQPSPTPPPPCVPLQELGRAVHMAFYVWQPDAIITAECDSGKPGGGKEPTGCMGCMGCMGCRVFFGFLSP